LNLPATETSNDVKWSYSCYRDSHRKPQNLGR